ncbi:MAG: alpha-glucosidase/alpha-galactosidase [Armatimonadetes bacterium]|nr:alpha-glucosidase/alpha-galactosidase [Armatimonadota bacterium]
MDQAVGDTIGPGGIFQGLRNAPDFAVIAESIHDTAPHALVINHSNPMAINCWMWSIAWPDIPHVGLCHSVQGTSRQLADYLDVLYEELDYWVAGINHMAWFLRLERAGEDLYPLLRERMEDPEVYDRDRVRFEVLRHFGYFVTESSLHMSEYCPWFRRTPELMQRYDLKSRDMAAMSDRWANYMAKLREELDGDEPIRLQRSHEYTVDIIEAIETDRPCEVNVSVPNTDLITNLPAGCSVEVPCLVDRRGVHPCHVGDLPPQLAALNAANVHSQELAVKAALEGDRAALYQALALDPLTGAVLSLEEIRRMADEMLAAQSRWLPQFA